MSPAPADLPAPVDVVGLPIRPFDLSGLIATVVARAQGRIPTFGCYANAHTVNLACADPGYSRVLEKCDLLFADGASIVWAAHLAGITLPGRITAMDYLPVLAGRCEQAEVSLFLLGSKPGVAEKARQNLMTKFPRLRIAGFHHGHFDIAESETVISAINAARPDILLVGMSSPRQEQWIIENQHRIDAPVRWCVGALFDYLAGEELRAPAWLCRAGFEWLFRLAMDPVGKWRRYVLGNPRFVWNTVRWLSQRRRPSGISARFEPTGGLHQ